jgi:hypothetical protein
LRAAYALFGQAPAALYFAQGVFGVLAALLIFLGASMLLGNAAGLAAGAFYLFYRMNYLYDVLRVDTAFSQFLITAALYFFIANRKNPCALSYLGFLAAALWASFYRLFFWVPLAAGAAGFFFSQKHWKKPAFLAVNLLGAGLALFLSARFSPVESALHKFGIHFHIANRVTASGLYEPVRGVPPTAEGHARHALRIAHHESPDPASADTYWIRKTLESIRARPSDFVRGLFRRAALQCNNFEISNDASVYYYERETVLKYLPRIPFAVIFGFVLPGVYFLVRERKAGFVLIFGAMLFLCLLPFFVCARYRMPLIPVYCILAGFGVCRTFTVLRIGRFRLFTAAVVLVVLGTLVSRYPLSGLDRAEDLHKWQKRARDKSNRFTELQNLEHDLQNWDALDRDRALNTLVRLATLGEYRRFFDYLERGMERVRGDRTWTVRLLKKKALVFEDLFDFESARATWRRLERFPETEALATQKTNEMNIYLRHLRLNNK